MTRKFVDYDALRTLPPGVGMPDGFAERIEAKRAAATFKREVDMLRGRVRGGDTDAEYQLAEKLFPQGLGRPDFGPEHY